METSSGIPAGTLTFLFTDIEGSTRLPGTRGDPGYRELLERCATGLRSVIEESDGVEIERPGAGFCAVFRGAGQAVAAAVEARRSLAGLVWPGGGPVEVGMGLHTAEADLSVDGSIAVAADEAARVGRAAGGGQILLGEATAALVWRSLPVPGRLRDLGDHRRLFSLEAVDVSGSTAPPPVRVAGERLFPATLVATKLFVPDVRQGFISRPELVSRVAGGSLRKLTLVCAPAGWGRRSC